MSGAIREQVFLGRDNSSRLEFLQDGNPFDASPVTRTQLVEADGTVLADTQATPSALTWSGNTLTLQLGDQNILPGRYRVRVVVYTPVYPDGLVILSEASESVLDLVVMD